MIIRCTPKDLDKYIKADKELSFILNKNGFLPICIDNKYVYYNKDDKILKFIEKEGLRFG